MKFITFKDITALAISPCQCYEWAEEAIRHKDTVMLPPKISLKPQEGVFCNFMPSIILDKDGKKWGGIKFVSRYPGHVPALDSQIILFDAENGERLALMDANWITTMRTGAVAAHSIELFAVAEYERLGIMGLGNVSRATLWTLAERVKRKLYIKLLRYHEQETLFANRFSSYDNLYFDYVDTPEQLVRDSQVVISGVTYAKDDFCSNECFDPGVLVVPIHTRGFTNCDLFFEKVYADDQGHVSHFGNFRKMRQFAEVSDVVCGRAPGRESNKERIMVYNIGISMHDVAFCAKIYQFFNDIPVENIDLNPPSTKFYI